MIVPYQGFIGGTYLDPNPKVGVEECMNMLPELTPAPGTKARAPIILKPTPGTSTFATAGNGPILDLLYENGRCFAISGRDLYEILSDGTATFIGTMARNAFPSRLAANGTGGNQIMAAAGGLGWIYNISTGAFAQITDVDFPANVVAVSYSDGYFLVSPYNSRSVYFSGSFNGLAWAATDVFQKSATTDNVVRHAVTHTNVFLYGLQKIEIWTNTGDPLQTFQPIDGVIIEHGLTAVESLTPFAQTLAWVGDIGGAPAAFVADGYQPVEISHPGVTNIWKTYERWDDAYSWAYGDGSHAHLLITFPTPKVTWGFDTQSKMWHRRGYLDAVTGQQQAHLGRCHAFAFGRQHLVGSRIDGTIYEMKDANRYDADSVPIRRVRRAPHIFASGQPMTINRFDAKVGTGVANATGQGSDPVLMFRYSVDGGERYSEELFLSTGKIGKYETEAGVDCLGQGDDWVFEIATSEPTDHAWMGADLDIDGDAG